MDDNLSLLVRVSVCVLVALILPLNYSLADDSTASQPSYDSLIENVPVCNANQDYSAAFNDELEAIALDPSRGDGISDCINSLVNFTPIKINLSQFAAIPASALPFTVSTTKTEVGIPLSTDQTVIIVPKNPLPSDIEDPVEDWPFGKAIYVYESYDGQQATLLCTVHYQTEDDAAMAHRVGSLLALLDRVYADRVQVPRADDSFPFHVWLCSTAPVSNGGEQWRNNIYFYDVEDQRSSIEWIREIAHEFSHLAFAAVGGSYTDPEAFANGYMGERLLVRWISRGAEGGTKAIEAAWQGTFDGYYNFNRILIQPPIAEFKKFGLNRNKLAERDAEGMRYLIGMMLTVDDRYGSSEVGALLQGLADQHSSDPNLLYQPVHMLLKTNKN